MPEDGTVCVMQTCRSDGRRPGHDLRSSQRPQSVREVSPSSAATDLLLQLLRGSRTGRHMWVSSLMQSTVFSPVFQNMFLRLFRLQKTRF